MSNPYKITTEMVDDILTCSMDSGSAYWTDSVVVVGSFPEGAEYASECLTRGRDLRWTDDDGTVHTLTLSKMKRGIRKAAEHFGQTPEAFHEDHDDIMADVAVQFALLGEIVYG